MSTYRHRSMIARFLALAAFGLGLPSAALAADAANTLRYGINDDQNITQLPQVIAEREGFFAREGLKVQIVSFAVPGGRFANPGAGRAAPPAGGAPPSLGDAMAKGAVDMSKQQFPLLINAVMAGGKYIGVASGVDNSVYYLVARPEIKTFADLKGKTVTITNLSDGITVWTRKLMTLHGVKNDDVTLKSIAGSNGRVACLKSGECAAASLAQPAVFDALDAGFHVLGITNEIGPPLSQVDTVNPAWAAAHRDLVVKYIRAITAAKRFIMDPKNHDEVLKVTMAYMKEPENRSRQMLAYIWDPKNRVLSQQAAFDLNDIKAAISLMGEYGFLKQPLPAPERFIDPTYAKAAGQ